MYIIVLEDSRTSLIISFSNHTNKCKQNHMLVSNVHAVYTHTHTLVLSAVPKAMMDVSRMLQGK